MTETEKFTTTRDRPNNLPTVSQRISTGYGEVYVNIGLDGDGDIFEVFVTTGQSGGFMNAWCEALGKTISNAVRCGADPGEIADDLMGIKMDNVGNDNGDTVYSVPDAVGIAMKRVLDDKFGESVRQDDSDDT